MTQWKESRTFCNENIFFLPPCSHILTPQIYLVTPCGGPDPPAQKHGRMKSCKKARRCVLSVDGQSLRTWQDVKSCIRNQIQTGSDWSRVRSWFRADPDRFSSVFTVLVSVRLYMNKLKNVVFSCFVFGFIYSRCELMFSGSVCACMCVCVHVTSASPHDLNSWPPAEGGGFRCAVASWRQWDTHGNTAKRKNRAMQPQMKRIR